MSYVVKTAVRDVPSPRGALRGVGAVSAAEEAAIAAAEAAAAEGAAAVAAEAAAAAAATVGTATAAASQAAVRARQTAEAAAAVAAEAAAEHGAGIDLRAGVTVGIGTTAAARTAVEARRCVAEALAAEEAAAAVADAAAAVATVVAASASAAAAAAKAREAIEVAAEFAGEAAAALLAVAATAAEATLDAASTAAEATLDAASATAGATLDAASAAAEATTQVAAAAAVAAADVADSASGPETAPVTAGSAMANQGVRAASELGSGLDGVDQDVHTEWAVMLADPVMARFAWDRAETIVTFASPAERGLWRDISLARRMEASLRVDVAEVEAAFFHAPAAMAVLAISADRPAEFLRVNPALAALTGYPLLTLLGSDLGVVTHPEERVGLAGGNADTRGGAVPQQVTRRWVHADGHDLWVRIRLAPAAGGRGGDTDRWVCLVDDITVSTRAAQTRHRLDNPLAGAGPEHSVLFYGDDRDLLSETVNFVSAGLIGSGRSVAVVTAELAPALRAALPRHRLARAEREGRFVIRDARQTLAAFIRGGSPDPDLFHHTVGNLIRGHANPPGPVSVFAMMVTELWKDGNARGALQLEGLWNQLQGRTAFTLMCAHPLRDGGDDLEGGLAQFCHPHSQVYLSSNERT